MLIALPVAAVLLGCDGLELPTALQLARERSDEVAIKTLERASAEADVSLARAIGFIPVANLTVVTGPAPGAHGNVVRSEGGTSNRSLNDLAPFVRLDANVVQPLWTWGQIDAARDAAHAGESAKAALEREMVSQVQLRVTKLFWAHVLAAKLLALSLSVEKALDEVATRLDDALKDKNSTVGPNDHFRLDVFRAELLRRRADAQKALSLSEVGLAATLAMDTAQLKLAEVPLPSSAPPAGELPQLLDEADRDRQDLAALGHAIDARKAQVRAAEAARLPEIFAAGTFSFAYAPNRDLQLNPWVNDPFREVSGGVVLGARENLSLHVLQAEAEKARAELSVLERQQLGLRRLVRSQVESARAEWQACSARREASAAGAKQAKAWFRSAELNFSVGVDDARSVVDAYAAYVESQVVLATTEYELLVARAQLDQTVGAQISADQGRCVPPEVP